MENKFDSNCYVFLDDNENPEENEKRKNYNDSELFNWSSLPNSSNKSNITTVIAQVKTASQNSSIVKYILFFLYCNPFVKILMNTFYQYCFDLPKNYHLDKILTKRERSFVKVITILLLIAINFILIFTNLFTEVCLKICLLFVNNLYLMYFVIGFYAENESKKKERKSSWEGLMNVLDEI